MKITAILGNHEVSKREGFYSDCRLSLQEGQHKMVSLLLGSLGADVDTKDRKGRTGILLSNSNGMIDL